MRRSGSTGKSNEELRKQVKSEQLRRFSDGVDCSAGLFAAKPTSQKGGPTGGDANFGSKLLLVKSGPASPSEIRSSTELVAHIRKFSSL